MRKRLIPLAKVIALALAPVAVGASGCSGCSGGTASISAAGSSGCAGAGNPAPKPTNKWVADCTADVEGPDNTPANYLTTYVQFTCIDAVYNVTLTLNVYRSTSPSGIIAGSGNLVTSKTCDSITGPCQIVIPCTEGRWLAGYTRVPLPGRLAAW